MAVVVFTRRAGRFKPSGPLMLNQQMPDARGLRVFLALNEQGGGKFNNLASPVCYGQGVSPSITNNSLYGAAAASSLTATPSVVIGYNAFLYPTTQLTVGCLHQYDPSLGTYLYGWEGSSTGGGCFINASEWRPYLRIGSNWSDPGNGVLPALTAGKTYWVWQTFNGSNVKDYQDGVLYFNDAQSGTITQPPSVTGLALNAQNDSDTTHGSAHRIIQFRLYDRCLGQDEIREIETEPWRAVTQAPHDFWKNLTPPDPVAPYSRFIPHYRRDVFRKRVA